MVMPGKISVLLVDDHEVVRSGYRRLLETTDDIVVSGEASDGEAAYSKYVEIQPDVLVMDLSMGSIGGLEASRKILARDESARILIFSVHENEVFLNRALDQGVLGYITKRSASQVMIEAVRQVATGEIYVGQDMVRYLVKRMSSPDGVLIDELTPREFEVFQLMVDSRSVNEIAEILNLSPKTVGHHCAHIKAKLGISDMAGLTRLAIRLGLITP